MERFCIELSDLRKHFSTDSLIEALAQCNQEVCITVPCANISGARWNIDIANDYLSALFVGEQIAKFCTDVQVDFSGSSPVSFIFKPENVEDLGKKIYWLSGGFDEELWDGDIDYDDVLGEVVDFSEGLESKSLKFPELGDKYLANFIPGFEQIADGDVVEKMFMAYPERSFGFWRSFISQKVGYDVYVSTWAWIVLNNINDGNLFQDLSTLLEIYGGFEDGIPSLNGNVTTLSINNLPPVILNDSAIMHFLPTGIKKAQDCAATIWQRKIETSSSVTQTDNFEKIYRVVHMGFNDKLAYRLSENGYLLVATDAMAQYVFFGKSLSQKTIESYFNSDSIWWLEKEPQMWGIPQRFLSQYWNAVGEISESLGSLSGNPIEVSLPWHTIDDEVFEQLCYDILGQVEMYNPDSRQKMGKSRSRDGGRDIIIYSRSHIGVAPSKWIVQCKLVKPGNSLTGKKVDVLTPVAKYGAQGFCLMTNAIIDSTLFDNLDDIARNLRIDYMHEVWDGLKIERFLARPQNWNIRKRYFPTNN